VRGIRCGPPTSVPVRIGELVILHISISLRAHCFVAVWPTIAYSFFSCFLSLPLCLSRESLGMYYFFVEEFPIRACRGCGRADQHEMSSPWACASSISRCCFCSVGARMYAFSTLWSLRLLNPIPFWRSVNREKGIRQRSFPLSFLLASLLLSPGTFLAYLLFLCIVVISTAAYGRNFCASADARSARGIERLFSSALTALSFPRSFSFFATRLVSLRRLPI